MIDTFKIFFENQKLPNTYLLVGGRGDINLSSGELRCSKYNYEGIRVYETIQGVTVVGSLAKFYLGNNLQTLTKKDIAEAIKIISKALQMNPREAKVTRLDVGVNIELKFPIERYLMCLGDIKNFEKSIINNYSTVRYTNGVKTIQFYNKIKEVQSKYPRPNITVDPNANILRYELQFKKKIKDHFKQNLYLNNLTEENILSQLCDQLWNYFSAIQKINIPKVDKINFENGTDFTNYLAMQGLANLGYDNVKTILKTSGLDKSNRCRINKKIKYFQNILNGDNHDMIAEVESKMNDYLTKFIGGKLNEKVNRATGKFLSLGALQLKTKNGGNNVNQ